jgi:hypothetical protein
MTQLEELATEVAEHAATVHAGLRTGLPSDRAGRDRLCAELHDLVDRAARLQELVASIDGPVTRTWRFTEGSTP